MAASEARHYARITSRARLLDFRFKLGIQEVFITPLERLVIMIFKRVLESDGTSGSRRVVDLELVIIEEER
jgi:hypothetical protein